MAMAILERYAARSNYFVIAGRREKSDAARALTRTSHVTRQLMYYVMQRNSENFNVI
jgi:hypothetical protein